MVEFSCFILLPLSFISWGQLQGERERERVRMREGESEGEGGKERVREEGTKNKTVRTTRAYYHVLHRLHRKILFSYT